MSIVRISNLVPTIDELTQTQMIMSGEIVSDTFGNEEIIIPYTCTDNTDGIDYVMHMVTGVQMMTLVVPSAGNYGENVFTEPGLYVCNFAHEDFGSVDADFVFEKV